MNHENRMDDNRLAKITKNEKSNSWIASEILLRRLNTTREQAFRIK